MHDAHGNESGTTTMRRDGSVLNTQMQRTKLPFGLYLVQTIANGRIGQHRTSVSSNPLPAKATAAAIFKNSGNWTTASRALPRKISRSWVQRALSSGGNKEAGGLRIV